MAPEWGLTAREYDVLEALAITADGSTKRAALVLSLSEGTVKTYIRRAMKKMRASTRTAAILLWDRHYRACHKCFAARLKGAA